MTPAETVVEPRDTEPTLHVGHSDVGDESALHIWHVARDTSGTYPAAHGVHGATCAAVGLTLPGAHGVHAVAACAAFAYVPALHAAHAGSAPADAKPALHGSSKDCSAFG